MEKKAMIGVVMAIIAVILIGISLAMPWYGINSKTEAMGQSAEYNIDFYLDHVGAKNPMTGEYETHSYSESNATSNIKNTFQTTQILDIVGLVLVLVGFIGALMLAMGKMKKNIAIILVLLGFIFALIAPMYLMTSLPPAIKADSGGYAPKIGDSFFGSESENLGGVSATVSWGGSTGWFMALIAAILMIIALIFVFLSKPEERMPSQYMYPEQYPPQQEMQQYPQYQQPPKYPADEEVQEEVQQF